MAYLPCKTCGNWCFTDARHVCPPQWLCWPEGYDESDGTPIYAYDASAAAVKFCEDCDPDMDYSIIRSGSGTVFVRAVDSNPDALAQCFNIEAESVPSYRAYEVPLTAKSFPSEPHP